MTTTQKTQLRGNCQCCGRDQAVTGGQMAKHGYEVKDGYFSGVCQGHKYQPIQKDREVADQIVKTCREDAVKLDQRAADFRAGKIHPVEITTNRYNPQTRSPVTIPWAEGTVYQKEEALKSAAHQAESRARAARSHADMLENLANLYHGQELRTVVVESGPAPILTGEKRTTARGECAVTRVDGARVYWKDDRGFKGWTGSQSWRKFPLVA